MRPNVANEFKRRLYQGGKVFGPVIGPGNEPERTVEAIKELGYDYLMIENEHSLVNKETVYAYIRAARQAEIPILMRPEEHYSNWRCFLDSGINGLMLSGVDTVEQAARAVSQAYFPPLGHRGSGIGMTPFLLDGLDVATTPLLDMLGYVNDNTLLLPQTESLTAIGNLSQTLRLEGVDGTVVGSNDLSIDIGHIAPGALRSDVRSSPELEQRLFEVARLCLDAGKIAGLGGFPPKGLAKWAKEGYQFFLLGAVVDGNVAKLEPLIKEVRDLTG